MQFYSDPTRENDPTALPDTEVWEDDGGWWWQACFPGCLPDGEPNGPFATMAEAVADLRECIEV